MRDLTTLNPVVTPAMQARALDAVLRRVESVSRARRVKAVVEVDLDLTALCPRVRTVRALGAVGSRYEIPEFGEPVGLPVLPGYTPEAWAEFLTKTGLDERYPNLPWTGPTGRGAPPSVLAAFHAAYWNTAWLADDDPTPGLGEFVRRVEDRGGRVVFLSGRWLPEHVAPSLASLVRAGLENPILLIGNPRHEELVKPGEAPLSDAAVKAQRQIEIREKFGAPVAVFDDRVNNRGAVIAAVAGLPDGGEPVLSVGIAVPGFSHDPATATAPLRVSTFEGFVTRGPDRDREPYVHDRYPHPADGMPYLGLMTGPGRNARGYVLPRAVEPVLDRGRWPRDFVPPFAELVAANAPRSVSAEEFMAAVERTIPEPVRGQIDRVLNEAERQAGSGLAAPFPTADTEVRSLRHTLACSWLHSRDLEALMSAIGYPLKATGVHDMCEEVPTSELTAAIDRNRAAGAGYSQWFLDWVAGIRGQTAVNIDFFNPNLTVSIWRWRSDRPDDPQDAMDAHRVSSHHEGNGADRYDPVEATINNLLHAREGVYGVQKSPVMTWEELDRRSAVRADAEKLTKSGWGGTLLADAVLLLKQLETAGFVMPWGLVR